MKYVLTVVVGALFVFGLYSYHEQSTKLKRATDLSDQLSQQKDSLAAQLQGIHVFNSMHY